jgi:hypothetical protein
VASRPKNPTEEGLSRDVSRSHNFARASYITVWVLYMLSIAASVLATVFAATESPGKLKLALLTAIPGIVLLISGTFKFTARSQWHYEKQRRLEALLRLSLAGAKATSEPEVAEKWNRIDEDMEESWPGWGDAPKPISKP